MMGRETPETCWATHKHQVIYLWNCCILLVELFESYDEAQTCERQNWEPRNQWRSIISQKPESSITVMWEPQHLPIHPHERCMEPSKQDLVATPMARMWMLCHMEVAWNLAVVTCVYIRVSYFVMLGFENLVEEFLHLWILRVILVYCWHKVRKIIVIECVWRF